MNITAEITNQAITGTFTYDNTEMLFLDLKNIIVKLDNKMVSNKINNVIKKESENFLLNAVNNLYKDAVNDFLSRQNNDYPFNGYGANLDYKVTYNNNCTLSYYYDNYQFTGGAHGSTVRKSDTFNLQNGSLLNLGTYFGNNYKNIVLNEVLRQARLDMQQNPGMYFEDYEKLIVKNFNPQSFYLTNDGIVIYYQQYDIGPYAIGITEFVIPYSLVVFPPICKKF